MKKCLFLAALCVVACDHDESRHSSAPDGLLGELASVPAETTTVGFFHATMREDASVASFDVSKYPVTTRQFAECVEAGVCREPAAECSNFDSDGEHDDQMALCVGAENAEAFCEWNGARLPRLEEWLLASRGPTVQRFSWGTRAPKCDEHPLANLIQGAKRGGECPASEDILKVGVHSAGASPFGIEDVLVAEGELLTGSADSPYGPCRGLDEKCIVYGLLPGAMDAVASAESAVRPDDLPSEKSPAYSFRCVVEAE